jgi:hypothetical protein
MKTGAVRNPRLHINEAYNADHLRWK